MSDQGGEVEAGDDREGSVGDLAVDRDGGRAITTGDPVNDGDLPARDAVMDDEVGRDDPPEEEEKSNHGAHEEGEGFSQEEEKGNSGLGTQREGEFSEGDRDGQGDAVPFKNKEENCNEGQPRDAEAKKIHLGGMGMEGTTKNEPQGSRTPPPDTSEWPPHCDPNYLMPDTLDVTIHENGVIRTLEVSIDRFKGNKPYYGGYRHKGTGRIYHHASSQCGQRERIIKETGHLCSRDTQTVNLKSRRTQTTNECGTQMARKDLHLKDNGSTEKTIGRYMTASEFWRIRARKVVVIQRYWRGCSARNRVWAKWEKKWEQEEKENEKEVAAKAVQEKQAKKEMQRRMNPTTAQDFEALYNELDQWRKAETKRIQDSGASRAERQARLADLLHKETRLLQTIDRLKITAVKDGRGRRVKHMLNLMSTPKVWEMGDGETAEIHTPWTQRAKELQELYEAIEAPLLSVEERLDVLLHLKWTVKEFDCRLTRDIVELVDREADLLARGRGEESLRGLRQRIRNLFLRFLETPDFNPEATRFLRVPPRYEKLTEEAAQRLRGVVPC